MEDPDTEAWMAHVLDEVVPKLEDSDATVSLVPEGETDIKFAVELGLSIMMDKPIILVIRPGTPVPAKLAKVADGIVEGDTSTVMGRAELVDRVHREMRRIVPR